MFSNFRIKNFKSFKDTTSLKISPITLLLGQNSSGKSSLVQTFLLIKQTLESPHSNEPIIINGSYCSIGDFNDATNQSRQNSSDSFEFKFQINYEKEKANKLASQIIWHGEEKFDLIDFHLHIGKPLEGQSQPRILSTSIAGKIGEHAMSFTSTLNTDLKRKLQEEFVLDERIVPLLDGLIYDVKIEGLKQKIEGVLLSKFLPDIMFVADDDRALQTSKSTLESAVTFLVEKDPHAQRLSGSLYSSKIIHLLRRITNPISSGQKTLFKDKAQNPLMAYITILLENQNLFREDLQLELEKWSNILTIVSETDSEKFAAILQGGIDEIRKQKLSRAQLLAKRAWGLKLANNPKIEFDSGVSSLKEAFKRIYYLGPLREEPKVFYNRLGANDPMYVGQRGENLAFVLKYYSKRRVTCVIPPENSKEDWNPYDSALVSTDSLQNVVIAWLKYIGIAKTISVDEMGKIGLTINANIYGNKQSDLLNVGVGVSQVLPLIVLGLASPMNCTLILEQPELHLHPYVQSRLADFFASLAAIGKQVIAETHSEHLIHRMRYLVAKHYIAPQHDVSIYYTQRNEEQDSSEVLTVNIDKYGSIDKWPEGFCDETEKQLSAILNASLESK